MASVALRREDERTKALRDTMSELPPKRFAGMMSGLDIHFDLGEGYPLLGRRMPDLDLVTAGGTLRVSSFGSKPRRNSQGAYVFRVAVLSRSHGISQDARGRRGRGRSKALDARPNPHGDHALLEKLVRSNPNTHRESGRVGLAASCQLMTRAVQ
jgi:hypothetical protein